MGFAIRGVVLRSSIAFGDDSAMSSRVGRRGGVVRGKWRPVELRIFCSHRQTAEFTTVCSYAGDGKLDFSAVIKLYRQE